MSPTKGAWLWSRDCFKILPFVVMQRVARVCQRQLSYLFRWLTAQASEHHDTEFVGDRVRNISMLFLGSTENSSSSVFKHSLQLVGYDLWSSC